MLARAVTNNVLLVNKPITSRGFSAQTGIVDTLILLLTSPDHPGSPSIVNVMPCPFPRVHRESFYEEIEDIDGSREHFEFLPHKTAALACLGISKDETVSAEWHPRKGSRT